MSPSLHHFPTWAIVGAFVTLLRRLALKKLAVAFVLVLSLFAINAAAGEWTGYISDAACATKKTAAAESDGHAGCAQGCAKKGGALMLVSGGKAYKIDDESKVKDHVGHKVTITGKMDGDTVKIESVKM